MTKLTIHAGLHKTGSSSFQQALHASRDDLASDGIALPPGRINNSIELFSMFTDHPERYRSLTLRLPNIDSVHRTIEEFRDKWTRFIQSNQSDGILLSGEDLSALTPQGWERLSRFFSRYVEDIAIVFVVREPYSWARSNLQQVLKGGWCFDNAPTSAILQRVERKVSAATSVFGKQNIGVTDYSSLRADPRGFCSALGQFCGLSKDQAALLISSNANSSMSLEAALLLDAINSARPLNQASIQAGSRRFGDFSFFRGIVGQPFSLPSKLHSQIEQHATADTEFLMKDYGIDVSGGALEDRAKPETLFSDPTIEAIRKLADSPSLERRSIVIDGQINYTALCEVAARIIDVALKTCDS